MDPNESNPGTVDESAVPVNLHIYGPLLIELIPLWSKCGP